jgi:hypothetical protein
LLYTHRGSKQKLGAPTHPFTKEERHEKKDLEEDYANIGEYAPELGKKYSDYYGDAMKAGELSEREKALVAKETKRTSWAQG